MKIAHFKAAIVMMSLVALGACAPRHDHAAIDVLRQSQIDDLMLLVGYHENFVGEQKARAAQGLSEAHDIWSAEIDLLRVKAALAREMSDREAWINQLQESVSLTEGLVARLEANARDPQMVDMNQSAVANARMSLVQLRRQLIEARQAE